jgi:hypothetical protein
MRPSWSSSSNEELLEHVQIHDTGNGRLHEEERSLHFSFAEGAKHVHLWAVTNLFQGDMWIFAAADPTVVTTEMKRASITENFGV